MLRAMMPTVNQKTDLSQTDVSLLSFWLGLPSAVRYMMIVVTILGAGWTARGTFSEWMGVESRVTVLERQMRDVTSTLDTDNKRNNAMLLFLMCRASEIDHQRSPAACQYYVREYPDLITMINSGNSSNSQER